MSDPFIYPCAHCGTKNRIPSDKVRANPNCGKCKQPIFPAVPVAADDAGFRREVEDCPLPVLVDFWAPWCGPCKMLAPELDRVAYLRTGRLKVVKMNVDENPRTASRFGVRSVPTLILFRGPLTVETLTGAMGAEAILQRIDPYL